MHGTSCSVHFQRIVFRKSNYSYYSTQPAYEETMLLIETREIWRKSNLHSSRLTQDSAQVSIARRRLRLRLQELLLFSRFYWIWKMVRPRCLFMNFSFSALTAKHKGKEKLVKSAPPIISKISSLKRFQEREYNFLCRRLFAITHERLILRNYGSRIHLSFCARLFCDSYVSQKPHFTLIQLNLDEALEKFNPRRSINLNDARVSRQRASTRNDSIDLHCVVLCVRDTLRD